MPEIESHTKGKRKQGPRNATSSSTALTSSSVNSKRLKTFTLRIPVEGKEVNLKDLFSNISQRNEITEVEIIGIENCCFLDLAYMPPFSQVTHLILSSKRLDRLKLEVFLRLFPNVTHLDLGGLYDKHFPSDSCLLSVSGAPLIKSVERLTLRGIVLEKSQTLQNLLQAMTNLRLLLFLGIREESQRSAEEAMSVFCENLNKKKSSVTVMLHTFFSSLSLSKFGVISLLNSRTGSVQNLNSSLVFVNKELRNQANQFPASRSDNFTSFLEKMRQETQLNCLSASCLRVGNILGRRYAPVSTQCSVRISLFAAIALWITTDKESISSVSEALYHLHRNEMLLHSKRYAPKLSGYNAQESDSKQVKDYLSRADKLGLLERSVGVQALVNALKRSMIVLTLCVNKPRSELDVDIKAYRPEYIDSSKGKAHLQPMPLFLLCTLTREYQALLPTNKNLSHQVLFHEIMQLDPSASVKAVPSQDSSPYGL